MKKRPKRVYVYDGTKPIETPGYISQRENGGEMTMWTPLNTALVIIACITVFMLEASIFVSGLIGVFFARKATEAQRALSGLADIAKGKKPEDRH